MKWPHSQVPPDYPPAGELHTVVHVDESGQPTGRYWVSWKGKWQDVTLPRRIARQPASPDAPAS